VRVQVIVGKIANIFRERTLLNVWANVCLRVGAVGLGASLLLFGSTALAAYDAASAQGVDLTGHWRLNVALSDDAEKMLQERLDEERRDREKWLKRAREENALGLPPLGEPEAEPGAEGRSAVPANPPRQRRRNRRDDELRQMLGISDTLSINQSGTAVDIVSQVDSRRFEAGSRSQVSMPQGELADSAVGWDGEWFVIERKASRGPKVVEKYRWLKKTDQLESRLAWSGDSPLAGIKVKRVYDRVVGDIPPPDPAKGPYR
jgi:hypothetical protein